MHICLQVRAAPGKTTCAKILARAVNCEHPVNGDPCNECAACRGILDGSVLDVTEIDAASNNGVDNIRDLRDETRYTPAQVQKRVFIIDEVHMLSDRRVQRAAENARGAAGACAVHPRYHRAAQGTCDHSVALSAV